MDSILLLAGLAAIAFVCEFIDSSLGMGYGTTLTPLLLVMGFSPLAIVPAILASELVTGAMAAFFHDRVGNVEFDFRNDRDHPFLRRTGLPGYVPRSTASRTAIVLGGCSLLGAVAATIVAVNIPRLHLKLFIGTIVLLMGVLILARKKASRRFSWKKITGLGVLAAFNKGLSGGGYGPLVTSGQILSGVEVKNSVAITSLAESFTCLVGVSSFLLLGTGFDWKLTLVLMAGAVLSVPFSTQMVKKLDVNRFTSIVGIATVILGLLTLYNCFF